MKVAAIVTGILMVLLGVYAFTTPFRVFLGIGWVLGILFIVNGVELTVGGFSKKKNVWQGVLGILVAICGFVLLFNGIQRFFTDVMVAYIIGFEIIVNGIYMVIDGVKLFKTSKGTAVLNVILGALEIILGIASVLHPILTMISVGYIIAASVMVQGINLIITGFSMKKGEAPKEMPN